MTSPQSLLAKYAPRSLSDLVGHPDAVSQLQSFAEEPFPNAFIFHGPTGVGKTAAAKALAFDLGCDPENEELGGLTEIPSGKQDGNAVTGLLRSLSMRPLYGSGWKIAILNEADLMTPQAEAIWLDGLEHLPPKTVVVFTRKTRPMIMFQVKLYHNPATANWPARPGFRRQHSAGPARKTAKPKRWKRRCARSVSLRSAKKSARRYRSRTRSTFPT